MAVRSNQLAYFVPEEDLEDTNGDGIRDKFTADGLSSYESSIQVDDVMSYLDTKPAGYTVPLYRQCGAHADYLLLSEFCG